MLGFIQLNLKTEYTLKQTAHHNASSFKSRGQNLGMWLKTSSMSFRDVFLYHLRLMSTWLAFLCLKECLPAEELFAMRTAI